MFLPFIELVYSHAPTLCDNCLILQERLSAIVKREPKPTNKVKPMEQRAHAILSKKPSPVGQYSSSLCDRITPPRSTGYDLVALKTAGCDPTTILMAGLGFSFVSRFGYDSVASWCDLSHCILVSRALFCCIRARALLTHFHATSFTARRPIFVHDAAFAQCRKQRSSWRWNKTCPRA